MKNICTAVFLFITAFFISTNVTAQVLKKLGDKAKVKIGQRADAKTDKTMDKGLDEIEEGTKVKKDEDGDVKIKHPDGSKEKIEGEGKSSQSLKSYSRFDFVPGDKIVYADDFSQDVIGEFPLKWNTNGSGEIVTLEEQPGKWLKISEGTKYQTPYNNNFPENYTVEFDLLVEFKDDQTVPYIKIQLEADKLKDDPQAEVAEIILAPNGGINVEESGDGIFFETRNGKGYTILEGKKQLYGTFSKYNHTNTPVHVSLWVQKQRIRVWINQDKMYDLPKGVAETMKLKKLSFETTSYPGGASNYSYFISNLKIAVAAPDTRNKLITEGKFSTTGILFDVNSDRIKPTSYGVLKEIATVLKENSDVKVKIVGHTDADGEENANQVLSEKRAAAVKSSLVKEFGITESNLVTEGKGESQPLDKNGTPEGKANNRRVEFIKQ